MMEYEDSISWSKLIWEKFPGVITFEEFIRKISSYEKISELPINNQSVFQFLNQLISFVKKYDDSQFENYALIPNQNEVFCKATKDLAISSEVSLLIAELIEKLGYKWKESHMHLSITSEPINTIHDITYASSKIQEQIKESNCDVMMLYILNDNQKVYDKRKQMYDIFHKVFPEKCKDGPFNIAGISPDIWDKADQYVRQKILKRIAECGRITETFTVEWLNETIQFFTNNGQTIQSLQQLSIFPNQKDELKPFNNLFSDQIKYSNIKDALKSCCDVDCYEILVNQKFTAIDMNPIYLERYEDNINSLYNTNSQNHSIGGPYSFNTISKARQMADVLIEYYDNNNKEEHKKINNIYNKIFKTQKQSQYLEHCMSSKTFKLVSVFITKAMAEELKHYKNIAEFSSSIGLSSSEDAFEILNTLYSFFPGETEAYLPNQVEVFCESKNLSYDTKISEVIFEIYNELKIDDDYQNHLVHRSINQKICIDKLLLSNEYSESAIYSIIDKSFCKRLTEQISNPTKEFRDTTRKLYFFIENEKKWESFPKINSRKDTILAHILTTDEDREFLQKINPALRDIIDSSSPEKQIFILDILQKLESFPQISSKKDTILAHILTTDEDREFLQKIDPSLRDFIDSSSPEKQKLFVDALEDCLNSEIEPDTINAIFHVVFQTTNTTKNSQNSQYHQKYLEKPPRNSQKFNAIMNNMFNFSFQYFEKLETNRETGYMGEAYVYTLLENSQIFNDVRWMANSDVMTSTYITFQGKKYYIEEKGYPYDIVAQDRFGNKYFFEVKSTIYGRGESRFPFQISGPQMNFMDENSNQSVCFIAIVFNAQSNTPKAAFFPYIPESKISENFRRFSST